MKERKKSEKIKELFKIVQEIKKDRYVGTKEAFELIKEIERINNNPKNLALEINDNLAKKEIPIYYKATPENVVGLGTYVQEVIRKIKVDFKDLDFNDDDDEKRDSKKEEIPLSDFSWNLYQKEKEKSSKSSYNDLKNCFINLFERSQKKGMDNKRFASESIEEILEDYPISYLNKMRYFEMTDEQNWEELFGRENYLNYLQDAELRSLKDNLKIEKRINRLFRDQVSNKSKYQRELVNDLIDINLISEESEKLSYESLRGKVKREIELCEIRLKKFIGKKVPKIVKESEENLLNRRTYLLNILGREKNFVERKIKEKYEKNY
ncbi:hypothetical protein CXT76_00535 [Candidatus Parvarchaeota archaeon]|jgi:hypothetical protein|nr:MAG: hypothetical protein CXT76_00535 [Candidatus Parvarchaeota archaeon]HIG52059.1 hypothetical protein [Candidatus Pacearchaeota archaeon]